MQVVQYCTQRYLFHETCPAAELQTKILDANSQLIGTISSIQAADEERWIFTDRAVKSCPRKLLGYAGLEGEDLSTFKAKFLESCKDHRIPTSAQLDKLREVMTGKALQHLPKFCKDITVAWEVLQEAFGNPRTIVNHRLKLIKSMAKLTDALVQLDPGYTAIWYLDFGAVVEDILELGKRSETLAMTCYSSDTICFITKHLPFMDYNNICDSDLEGLDLLQEILILVKSRRANAQRRAWRAAA